MVRECDLCSAPCMLCCVKIKPKPALNDVWQSFFLNTINIKSSDTSVYPPVSVFVSHVTSFVMSVLHSFIRDFDISLVICLFLLGSFVFRYFFLTLFLYFVLSLSLFSFCRA